MTRAATFTLAILGLIATSVATLPQTAAAEIALSGKVTYRERMALPSGATLQVQLIDVSRPDAPATVEGETVIAHSGQVPVPFTLSFDSALIRPGHGYALSATISAEGSPLFRNATRYPIDPLAPPIPTLLLLNLVPRGPPPLPAPAIANIAWHLTAIGGEDVAGEARATLSIGEDGRVGGSGGCNRYFAQAEIAGDKLEISAIASTRMACPPPISDAETAYFAALGSARTFAVAGKSLVFIDKDGNKVLTLVRHD